MDEAKKVFYADVSKKAVIARGSHNVNRNFNNNKMYTRKEVKEMSGETKTINVYEFIPYKEFRKLSPSLQELYVRTLTEKYQVCKTSFAKLWDVDPSTSWKVFKEYGIKSYKFDPKKEKKFLREMKPKASAEANVAEKVEADKTVEVKADVVDTKDSMLHINPNIILDYTQLETRIKFDTPEDVCRFFMRYIPLNANVKITLVVEKKEDK